MALTTVAASAFFGSWPAQARAQSGSTTPSGEPSTSVARVESATKQAEGKVGQGLPTKYELEFGDSDDWIQFKTGEWLRGKLHALKPRGIEAGFEVEFYSEELEDLSFSWGDVAAVYLPNVRNYTFKGGIDVAGKGMVVNDKVVIETKEGIKTYSRDQLTSISEGPPRERTWWSTELSLGFSANAGNTNQGSLTTEWGLMRNDGHTLAALDYQGTVGYANDELNVNRHLTTADVDLFLWDRVYLVPMIGQLLYDKFQNTKLRATPAAGVGVHVFEKKKQKKHHTNKFEWDVQSGLGYQFIRFFSTAAGVSNPQNDGFVMLRTFWKLKFFGDNVELKIDWQTNLVYTTFGNTNHTGKSKLSVEITDVIDLSTSFLFLRTRGPLPKSDGTVPKKNDYQVVVSIGFKIH
jgi:putative salt-induced outer membrane protein YdiY